MPSYVPCLTKYIFYSLGRVLVASSALPAITFFHASFVFVLRSRTDRVANAGTFFRSGFVARIRLSFSHYNSCITITKRYFSLAPIIVVGTKSILRISKEVLGLDPKPNGTANDILAFAPSGLSQNFSNLVTNSFVVHLIILVKSFLSYVGLFFYKIFV